MKYDRDHVVHIFDELPPDAGSEAEVILALVAQLGSDAHRMVTAACADVFARRRERLAFPGKLWSCAMCGRT